MFVRREPSGRRKRTPVLSSVSTRVLADIGFRPPVAMWDCPPIAVRPLAVIDIRTFVSCSARVVDACSGSLVKMGCIHLAILLDARARFDVVHVTMVHARSFRSLNLCVHAALGPSDDDAGQLLENAGGIGQAP